MDARTLTAEVRLETKAIPRDRVARIIWFHAAETADPEKGRAAKDGNRRPARGTPTPRPACRSCAATASG